jgi:hypothetical protein
VVKDGGPGKRGLSTGPAGLRLVNSRLGLLLLLLLLLLTGALGLINDSMEKIPKKAKKNSKILFKNICSISLFHQHKVFTLIFSL